MDAFRTLYDGLKPFLKMNPVEFAKFQTTADPEALKIANTIIAHKGALQ
jgi:hypothetical protein